MAKLQALIFIGLVSYMSFLGAGCAPAVHTATQNPSPQTAPATTTTDHAGVNEQLLTEKDFRGYGLGTRRVNQTEDFFHVQINPAIPAYTFHVISFVKAVGKIEIFRETNLSAPIQTIPLDPEMRLSDMAATFFNVQDVNFDGFADIGLPVDGGAKWSSYQYWIFDQKTGMFIQTPLTDDFKKISFNFIAFDPKKRQVTTDNLAGAGWRTLYQFQNNHIFPIKDESLDSLVQHDKNELTDHPTLHCTITTTTSVDGKKRVSSKKFEKECDRSMHTIPFEYPEEFKDRFR